VAGEPQTPARGDAAVAVLPRPATKRRVDLARLLPSGRSVAITAAVAVLGAGLYLLARESSLFAVQTIDVTGAPPRVVERVRTALAPFVGASLVTLDGAGVERRLADLPVVAAARYDRDFPHTLRIFVRPERPVAVVRKGPESWLVSARGRVMETLDRGESGDLPRIWVDRSVTVSPGDTLEGDPARAVEAASPLAGTPLRKRVVSVRATPDELTLVLRSGLELRLGDARNLSLKLTIGQKIAAVVGPVSGYIDLAVPGRPVSKLNPKPGE
jgi:cell division protein FtsQ